MTREPRRVDLSFLNEEEAKQIFRVLERDSQLKRAEKERISKLHKEKEDATGLPGVTGEWFEEIQKRKFQNEADAGKMLKQPLAHRLRKAIGNDAKPSTPQIPQAQKNASPSILGGLRTPFASLFSSFRKSKRQHSKPLQKQPQYPPRYDHFAAGSHMSSKVEEMAKTETRDSPLPSEPADKGLDANQAEMTDDSTCTWNEQLENELLRVLGSLDDQLAREQSREAGNRRAPSDSGSRAPDIDPCSTVTRQSFLGGVQRNERSMFLPDGTRTVRATDEQKALFRPRVPCDAYTKRLQVKDCTYGDAYGRSSPVLKRGNSTRSLGHSSEGSLHLPPGQCGSGFGPKDFMARDSVGRSYSLSCLARRPSWTSVDQLSTASQPHPLECNRFFAPRNYRQHPRRTPLSSVVWNTPPPSEHPVYPDRLLRTQSLMEFGPVFEDTYPCSLQEDTRYEFYRTKINYRRAVPTMNNPVFADQRADPLGFDNRENYLLHQLERNAANPRYRYPSFHGRMSLSRKSFPSGRIEERLLMPSGHHYYNDDVFVAPDADVERIPPNLKNWQGTYAKKMGLRQCERDASSRVSDYVRRHMERSEGLRNKPFVKQAEGVQTCPALDLSVRKGQTDYATQRQNPFIRAGQNSSKTLVKHFETKRNFKTQEDKGADQQGKMNNGDDNDGTLRLISNPVDAHSPTESSMPPCKNSSIVESQSHTSLKPPHVLCSKSETKKSYLLNIHSRTGQRNEDDCAINSDLDQTPPPQLTANNSRTSILHLLEQEGQAMESLGAFTPNKTSEDICSSTLSRGPKGLFDDELPYSCTEDVNKCNRFVKHTTSSSVTGSPGNSPPKSPVAYYTLPRKSASIDGSIISEKPISSAARQISFKNNKAVGDSLETITSNRIWKNFPKHRAKSFLLSSAHSPLSPSLKDVASNISPTKGNPSLITQEPNHSVGSKNAKGKSTIVQSPDKTEISVLSECEGTDVENPLKQYKTTSTLTVSIEEDNVKYHELISVYYTLPRKQSRMLGSLFLDDNQSADSSPPKGKFEPPQKKYEVRIGLGRVAFPSSLEKGGKTDSPGKMAATQNSKTSDDANKEDFSFLKPVMERASLSMVHNRKDALGSPAETPDLAFSNQVVSHGPAGDPKPSETLNDSVSSTTSRQFKVHIFKLPSQLQEESKADTSLSHSSSNSTDIRQDVEVKGRACYRGRISSQKGSGLQLRSENVGSSTDEAFVSEAKVHSKFQNQASQVDAASTADPALLGRSSLEYAKEQKEMPRNSLLREDCTNSQRSMRNSADYSKDQPAGTAQNLPDSSGTENKLILDSTKDKASDIEKRKNRPSIKNKLAAMYKTSRKFSSKKTSSSKPHISNIFSQNDTPLEISHPHGMLISPDVPPSLLQAGNENQNRNPLADEFDNMVPDKPDNKKPQTNEGPPLLTSEVRRPFTNLCNQKRGSPRIETPQNSTALFPKGGMSVTSSNSQTDDGLENISCSVSSKIIVADPKQMKKDVVNVGEPSFFPLSSDDTSNILNKSYSKICPPQKMTSPTEYDHQPNIKQPNRLRKLSRPYIEPVLNPSKAQRERHFSESSYTRAPCDRLASRSSMISHGSRYNRKFKSHSELLSCDENENWETDNESYRTFGSRRVLYPSIEFGIFGKEQQQAFLDNIKRSLTEGRLWSPCLLKNSSSLRKEEDGSLNRSQLLSSSFAEKNTPAGDSRPDVPREDPTDDSDSDSDTTTDDEYYLDENDKESEL